MARRRRGKGKAAAKLTAVTAVVPTTVAAPREVLYTATNPYPDGVPVPFYAISYFNDSVRRLVLASLDRDVDLDRYRRKINDRDFEASGRVDVKMGYVVTHDGAELDTFIVTPRVRQETPESERPYIIKFNTNGMCSEEMFIHSGYAEEACRLGATIITFNYRGVGNSTQPPVYFQDLVTDGVAQVHRLLSLGVDSKRIILDGHSLGGAVATLTAKHLHDSGLPVYIWNDRSFGSLSQVSLSVLSRGMIPSLLPLYENQISRYVLGYLLSSVMAGIAWEALVVEAYNNISAEYKGHAYIAAAAEDGVIDHPSTLHSGVQPHEEAQGISTGYAFVPEAGETFAHMEDRCRLFSTQNPAKSADAVFSEFVARARMGGQVSP